MNQPKVFVAVPNLGKINTELVHWLLFCNLNFQHKDVPISGIINLNVARPVEVNRNLIAKQFLESDCTHLLMIDADVQALPELIPTWLKHDKDIIGGCVPIWNPSMQHPRFFAYNKLKGDYIEIDPTKGFQRCDLVGSGAIMIKRKVIETLPQPLFKQVLKKDGSFRMGEDQYFVETARDAGFQVWCDPAPMDQRTEINLMQTMPKEKLLISGGASESSPEKACAPIYKNKLFIGRQQKTPEGTTIDIIGEPDIKCDISKAIPCKDNQFDYIEIHHLLEHFEEIVPIMQELHRISTENGIIDIKVPYKDQGFGDPTHKKFFDEHTFERFTKQFWDDYGSKCWYNDKFYKIIDRKISKTELQIILQTQKQIKVKA